MIVSVSFVEYSYIEESRRFDVIRWDKKVFIVSSSTEILEFWGKDFVLDLKLFFNIVDCFLARFAPRLFYFIYYKTSLFNWFY